jgi:death-on-curing protein
LVKNHPFLDGNKRIGFMAAYTFLGINGYSLEASEESAVEFTLALAAGAIGEDEYATWLQKWSVKDE